MADEWSVAFDLDGVKVVPEQLWGLVTLINGATDVVEEAAARGPVGLASSAPREVIGEQTSGLGACSVAKMGADGCRAP